MSHSLSFAGGAWEWVFAFSALLAFFYHASRSRAGTFLLGLRGAAVLMLALAMVRPTLSTRTPVLVKPRLLILLDAGHSMQASAGGSATRLQAAKAWLADNRKMIESRAEPWLVSLSDRARIWPGLGHLGDINASEAAFDPSQAVLDLLDASVEAERAWLLSDGNALLPGGVGGDTGFVRLGLPIDVIGVGPRKRGSGIGFSRLKTPDFVFLHARFPVAVKVEAAGLSGENLTLELSKETRTYGKSGIPSKPSWTTVESRRVVLKSDFETVSATFTATARILGFERYRLTAKASGSAGVSRRASREFRVEVIRQKYRIMYLSGRPSAGYANLRQFLKSNPNHELVSFVILRNPKQAMIVPDRELSLIVFPARQIFVDDIAEFDLFIIENFSYKRFRLPPAYLASLKNFVAKGGALLVIGGENAFRLGGYRGTPLEEMLPVTLLPESPDFVPELFKVRPVALKHPLVSLFETPAETKAAWAALPPLDGYARFGSVKPGATVLAVHPQAKTADGEPLPVLALRPYGRGKVMLVSTDSTWRWRLGAAKDWKTSTFYTRFWTRAVEYLTGTLDLSKVKFAPLPDKVVPLEPAVFTVRVFDEKFRPAVRDKTEIEVVWTDPGGALQRIVPEDVGPGEYRVSLTGLAAGSHRLKASARWRGKPWGEDEVRFLWEPGAGDRPVNREFLESVAESTGGRALDLGAGDPSELLKALPPVRRESEESIRRYPWAGVPWLGLMFALFLLEWGLRRRRGLP